MSIDEYVELHSDKEPAYLARISRLTHLRLINPRMLSGHVQGRFLTMICHMLQPKRVLELGTYAGYSALCMAEAMPVDGVLHTIESDDELEDFILENLATVEHGKKICLHIGEALNIIQQLDETFDLVFIDADKREYSAYFEAVLPKLRKGGFIIADNTLWDAKVLTNPAKNDYQTIEIQRFNSLIANDSRVEKVILPLRDGITLIRKL